MSDIIEAAARALEADDYRYCWGTTSPDPDYYPHIVRCVLAAVTPLIRAAALEEAAQRIEADEEDYLVRNEVAAAIRALKEQP
jgi:hypothetical protein